MCGIAGIFNLVPGPAPRGDELAPMVAALRHRGPDGNGRYLDDRVALGHARLSIIDLAGGAQPIRNEDGTVQVILNGEIFNYLELRRGLEQRAHRFYTDSDTEVIVHLYEEHGERFVEHLNGQFAIALWDRTRRQLVLARDRAGIRPLFYARAGGRLLFASEVKALFAHPGRAAAPVRARAGGDLHLLGPARVEHRVRRRRVAGAGTPDGAGRGRRAHRAVLGLDLSHAGSTARWTPTPAPPNCASC